MDEVIFEEFKGTGNMELQWIEKSLINVSSQQLI
jgi:transcription termination factor Rho